MSKPYNNTNSFTYCIFDEINFMWYYHERLLSNKTPRYFTYKDLLSNIFVLASYETSYECQKRLSRQESVNINWVNVGFYAHFVQSILMQSLMVFKIKLRKERPMDTGNVVNSF